MKQIIKIQARLGRHDEMVEAYRQLLQYAGVVTRNAAEKKINRWVGGWVVVVVWVGGWVGWWGGVWGGGGRGGARGVCSECVPESLPPP